MFCTLFCAEVGGAERGSWDEVQGLSTGQILKIATKGGTTHKGAFASLAGTSLRIVEGSAEASISKDDVLRVEVRAEGRRARNVLIAAGVGLAIGIVLDQTLGTIARNETGEDSGTRVATVALPAALLGGIAALFPGYRTVYRAPKERRR